jgi:hypothetical protein
MVDAARQPIDVSKRVLVLIERAWLRISSWLGVDVGMGISKP